MENEKKSVNREKESSRQRHDDLDIGDGKAPATPIALAQQPVLVELGQQLDHAALAELELLLALGVKVVEGAAGGHSSPRRSTRAILR